MPFNQLQRRDSWPPTIIRIDHDESVHEVYLDDSYDPIDENPFSYFLTPPEEIEDVNDMDFEDLSAGIESTKPNASNVRAISPSSLGQVFEEKAHPHTFKLPKPVRDIHKSRPWHQQPQEEDNAVGLGIDIPEPTAMRGRSRVRAPFRASNGVSRGRGQTKSLPSRTRSHSWRLPSPDVWSIEEEGEDGRDDANTFDETEVAQYEVGHTPAGEAKIAIQTQESGLMESPKGKKRVHWAL